MRQLGHTKDSPKQSQQSDSSKDESNFRSKPRRFVEHVWEREGDDEFEDGGDNEENHGRLVAKRDVADLGLDD